MHRSSLHQLAQRPKHGSPPPRHRCGCYEALPRTFGLLYFDELNSIEGIFEDIGQPDPWHSTIDFLWSYLLIAVDEEWISFGNKLSDRQVPCTGGLGTSADSASYSYDTVGFSGETASQGLFCMLGLAPDVVAW